MTERVDEYLDEIDDLYVMEAAGRCETEEDLAYVQAGCNHRFHGSMTCYRCSWTMPDKNWLDEQIPF